MRAIRKLLPAFIKALDYRLLINKPTTWETQVHTMAFLFSVAIGVSLLASFLLPLSISQIQNDAVFWVSVSMGVISLVLLGFWMRSQFTQQVEAHHGKYTAADAKRRFGYYAVVLFLSAIPVLLPPMIYDARVDFLVVDDEFSSEIEQLNQAQAYFPLYHFASLNIYELINGDADKMDEMPFFYSNSSQEQSASASSHSNGIVIDDFNKKYQEYLSNPQAFEHIEAYLNISEKYLGEPWKAASIIIDDESQLDDKPLTATEVLALFKDKRSSFSSTMYYQLQRNVEKIAHVKTEGMHLAVFDAGNIFGVLLILLFLTNMAIVARYVGLKYFAVIILGATFALPLLGAFLTIFLGVLTIGLLVLVGAGVFGKNNLSNKVRGMDIFRSSAKRSNFWVGLGQLFFFPVVLGILYMGTGYFSSTLDVELNTILGVMTVEGLLVAIAFVHWVLPSFHRTYLKLSASPAAQ